jgi:hypothetical protein
MESITAIETSINILNEIDKCIPVLLDMEKRIHFEKWDLLDEGAFMETLTQNFLEDEVDFYRQLHQNKQSADAWVLEKEQEINQLLSLKVPSLISSQSRVNLRQELEVSKKKLQEGE